MNLLEKSLLDGLLYGGKYQVDGEIYTLYGYRYNDKALLDEFGLPKFSLRNATVLPVLRHMLQVTEEIVQKDYNSGQPFIPIYELVKNTVDGEEKVLEVYNCIRQKHLIYVDCILESGRKYRATIDFDSCSVLARYAEMLDKFHFNRRWLPPGGFVDVKKMNKNPYA